MGPQEENKIKTWTWPNRAAPGQGKEKNRVLQNSFYAGQASLSGNKRSKIKKYNSIQLGEVLSCFSKNICNERKNGK